MAATKGSVPSSSNQLSEKKLPHDPTILSDEATGTIENFHANNAESALIAQLNRKLDFRVLPPLIILYFFSYLDRGNMGNAKIQGIEKSLGMVGQDYSIALCVFFVPYILFEVPSNLILKRLRPSTWLSILVICWGIITMCQGFIQNFAGIVGLRFVLGVFEAGVFPGCMYIVSMYYQRYELQWRFGLFFTSTTLAGAFGGLLAYAIAKMDGLGGLEGWRWIFIIEGIITTTYGLCTKFLVVDWPDAAKFLTNDERELLKEKMAQDDGAARMDRLTPAARRRIFLDWKIYACAIIYMGSISTTYAVSFFAPTIVAQLGYSAAEAQLRTIPLYAVAISIQLSFSYLSDKFRARYIFIIITMAIGIVGYCLFLANSHVSIGVRYFACFLITITGFTALPLVLTWSTNQMMGQYKRSIGVAMVVGLGNCGGVIASNVFIKSESPQYKTGVLTCLAMLMLASFTAIAFALALVMENKKRDCGERDYRLEDRGEADNLGDDHPSYRYVL